MAAKKKTAKKKVKKPVKDVKEEPKVSKKVEKTENKQLIWFFVIVMGVFAGVLIPYFWIEGSKTFEYADADWVIENYEDLEIFHGRFPALNGADLFYNVYLRVDPRQNDVETTGTFDKFKYGGIISLEPEVDECRGELARAMIDLGAFMRQGLGVGPLSVAYTDKFYAVENEKTYAECSNVKDRTLVVIRMGEEPLVVQDEENPYCYTIYAKDCKDSTGIEKFMVETIDNFSVRKQTGNSTE